MILGLEGWWRTLSFYAACQYPPTWIETWHAWDAGEHNKISEIDPERIFFDFQAGVKFGYWQEKQGRVVLAGQEHCLGINAERSRWVARKMRRARWIARWLCRLGGVRFVALCNTTAWEHAPNDGDLDFFIITCSGTIWQTRALAALPFKLVGWRPASNSRYQDPVCLSFFIDEQTLDLSAFALSRDVYLRHWFLSLLPLYDDGIGRDFWEANAWIRQRYPNATPWSIEARSLPSVSHSRLPTIKWFEPVYAFWQRAFFPVELKRQMNQDTSVVVTPHVLKFHVQDGRERYREAYETLCRNYGVEP